MNLTFLHLESIVFLLWTVSVCYAQIQRGSAPTHFVRESWQQYIALVFFFGILTVAFESFLFNDSPLLAIELSAGFTLALLHPVNALSFLVFLLYLRPWELLPENPLILALPRMSGFCCFLVGVLHFKQLARLTPEARRCAILFFSFSGWMFLSCFFNPGTKDLVSQWFSIYFRPLILFVMCILFIEDEIGINEFQRTLLLSSLTVMLLGFYQFHSGQGSPFARLETEGMVGNSNDLAAVVILTLPLALLYRRDVMMLGFRNLPAILYAVFSLIVIWESRSRAALLALGVLGLLKWRLARPTQRWIVTATLFLILLGGYSTLIRLIPRSPEEMMMSTESRKGYWKAALKMTAHHPLFGVGFNQYPANVEAYQGGVQYEPGQRAAHSSWLLAFAEGGLPGGALFAIFIALAFRVAWQNRRRWPGHFYALAGYAVTMTFLSHTYLVHIYLLIGLILAADAFKGNTPLGA